MLWKGGLVIYNGNSISEETYRSIAKDTNIVFSSDLVLFE